MAFFRHWTIAKWKISRLILGFERGDNPAETFELIIEQDY